MTIDPRPYQNDLRQAIRFILAAIDHRPSESVFSHLHFLRSELVALSTENALCACCGHPFYRAPNSSPTPEAAPINPLDCESCR